MKKAFLIEDIHVTGTRTLGSSQLNDIIGPLNQRKVGSSEEINERLRTRFQDYGYFDMSIESLEVKPIDPLETPTRVLVEAEVSEGIRYRIGDLQFKGIHALAAGQLRAGFPIHAGDFFSRSKIGSGLESMRKAYSKQGYIDIVSVPEATKGGDGRINLNFDVEEGRQYRMGELQFAGNSDVADKLRPRWELDTGKPFDASYVERFFKQNESLFPPQLDLSHSVSIARNCKENTVAVFVELGPNHPSVTAPRDQGCDQKSAAK